MSDEQAGAVESAQPAESSGQSEGTGTTGGDEVAQLLANAEKALAEGKKPGEAAGAEDAGDGDSEPGEEEAKEETKPKNKLPPPQRLKPKSMRERIAAREARQAEQQQQHALQQRVDEMQRKLQETESQFTRRQNQAQKAIDDGDFDKALELSLGMTAEQFDRARIERKGKYASLSPEDQKRLKELDDWKAQQERSAKEREEQYRRQQDEQRQQQEIEQDYTFIQDEMKSSEYEELHKLSEVTGFVPMVRDYMLQDPELTVAQAAANAIPAFQEFWKQLDSMAELLEWRSSQRNSEQVSPPVDGKPENLPSQAGARPEGNRGKKKPPTNLPQSGAAEASGKARLDELSNEEYIQAQLRKLGVK